MYYLNFEISGIGVLSSKMYTSKREAKLASKILLQSNFVKNLELKELPEIKTSYYRENPEMKLKGD